MASATRAGDLLGRPLRRITRKRLRLGGVPRPARLAALALVGLLVTTAVVVVLSATLGSGLPGGTLAVPERAWPRLAFLLFMGGLAIVAGATASATALPGARFRAPLLLAIALCTASVGARMFQVPDAAGAAPQILGVAGLGGATMLLAVAAARWHRPGAGALATAAAFAPVAWLGAEIWAVATGDTGLEAALVTSVMDYLRLSDVASGVLVLWGTFAILRTARSAGALGGRSVIGAVPVLLGVLVAKLAWIGIGLTGRVPSDLPEAAEAWRRAGDDGPWAWIAAGIIAGGAVLLVTRARRRIDERGVRGGFWVLVGAFTIPTAIGTVLVMSAPLAHLAGEASLSAVRSAVDVANGFILPVQLAVTLVLPLLAAVAWRLGERSIGLTLAVASAWLVPLGIATAWPMATLGASGSPIDPLLPSPLAVDTLLTLGAGVVCVHARLGHRWTLDPRLLLVAMLVTGIAANTGLLIPEPVALPMMALLLIYPVAWTLLVDAAPLNLPGPGRPFRVVWILASSALLLLLAMMPLALGERPDAGMTSLARLLMALPVGVALVHAWWGRERRLPRLDRPLIDAPSILTRVDAFDTGWRLAAGTTLLLGVGLAIWAHGTGRPPEAAPTGPPGASAIVIVDIPPGTVLFGSRIDIDTATLEDAGDRLPVGAMATWAGRLSRPTSGDGLELLITREGVPFSPLAVTLPEGGEFVWLMDAFPLTTEAVFSVTYREHGEVLASGTLQVVDP